MKLRRCVYTYVGSVLLLVAAVWAVCALVQQRNYGRLAELERRQSDLTTDSCRLQLQAFERSFLSGKGKALRNKIAAGNLLERGENDLADSLCRQSLRYFDFFTRDSVRIAHLYLLSGRIERARGNWLGAVDALLDAKAYGTSMPDDDEFAYRVHERLAFLYRENGLPDRERDCLREALIYARRLGKGDYVADGLRRLACLEGNVRTVQPSVRQLTEAKDSACANRQEQLAGQLQLLSDYRRWRKDADRAEYKVVLRGRALYRTLAVMLAVMAVLLTIYFYDRRRRLVAENRLLAEQTRREQERMDREQLRMDYYRQLNQLTLPMAYDSLREGKVRMGEKEWQTIYANTDACFPGFTGRLRTTFPFLKEDDIRLCCLVKMEMPLDLMALIFGIGKGSVSQRKQRLRQKMELEGSLDEYLGVASVGRSGMRPASADRE